MAKVTDKTIRTATELAIVTNALMRMLEGEALDAARAVCESYGKSECDQAVEWLRGCLDDVDKAIGTSLRAQDNALKFMEQFEERGE